jgi:hypothetical protein
MRQARRRLFIGSALIWPLSRVTRSRAAPPVSPSLAEATLAAYVDVLIPADQTPSGTALGVDKHLIVAARERREYQLLLEWGVDWLNNQAQARYGRNFAESDEAGREAIVAQAATTERNTRPWVFFEWTRTKAFFHYYARPESWRGIVQYRGPTQPLGFMDYASPPRALRR